MRLDVGAVLRESWHRLLAGREPILGIAGALLFLPAFALALLTPAPPGPPARQTGSAEAQAVAWADALQSWAQAYGGWYMLAYAIGLIAGASLYALTLEPRRPDVRSAFGIAARVAPRYLLATVAIALPAGLGMLLWVVPGLYVLGRTMPVAPAIVIERPIGALRAIRRGLVLGRGNGIALTTLAALPYIGGWLCGQPFLLIDAWLRTEGGGNPFAIAIVDAAGAAVAMAAGLAQILIGASVYRRLASSGT